MNNISETRFSADIQEVIASVCNVQALAPNQDMYDAGVTSLLALPLLMELEARFNIAIPDDRFIEARTIADLDDMITGLCTASENQLKVKAA